MRWNIREKSRGKTSSSGRAAFNTNTIKIHYIFRDPTTNSRVTPLSKK